MPGAASASVSSGPSASRGGPDGAAAGEPPAASGVGRNVGAGPNGLGERPVVGAGGGARAGTAASPGAVGGGLGDDAVVGAVGADVEGTSAARPRPDSSRSCVSKYALRRVRYSRSN